MSIIKKMTYAVKGFWLGLVSRYIVAPPREARDIPIVINNFNRLSTLRRLIDSLEKRGIRNIIILDNNSTYEPLLEWYATCPYTIIRLGANLGFKAIWKSPLTSRLRHNWFVYTDSDVELSPECPDDLMERMLSIMAKLKPHAIKIGPSLRIDDLPDCYSHKQHVISHESKFWKHAVDGLYRAPIDTTFALYRPFAGLNRSRAAEAYRLAPPYSLRHIPWYSDSKNPSEEEIFYRQACERPTMWSSAK